MNATLTRLEKDLVTLRAQLAKPSAALSPLEVARRSGLEPDPWQAAFLARRGNALLCCGRQTGKTTTVALRATHQAIAVPGTTTIITAPTLRQSQLHYAKVRSFHLTRQKRAGEGKGPTSSRPIAPRGRSATRTRRARRRAASIGRSETTRTMRQGG